MAFATALSALTEAPKLVGVGDTMQEVITINEISGAITVVVAKDKTLHWETTGAYHHDALAMPQGMRHGRFAQKNSAHFSSLGVV